MRKALTPTTKPAGKKMRAVKRSATFCFLFVLIPALDAVLCAQVSDSSGVNQKRFQPVVISAGAAYAGSLVALSNLWYSDFERSEFHFFNDLAEWKQLDKAGHFFSAYFLSHGTSRTLGWCNVPARKADLAGAVTGFLLLAPIELLDGYSAAYGASSGDLLANAGGAAFFLGQERLWNEQRLLPKFSFSTTRYAALRPEVLGKGTLGEIVKDYNGQTFWISADMDKFMPFPEWLNLAVGYGAEGMVHARDADNRAAGYHARRQFYISLDPDLSAIKSHSKVVKTLLFLAGMIKIPSPTLSLSGGRVAAHPFFF